MSQADNQNILDVNYTGGVVNSTNVNGVKRITPKYLTKFERARVLGARANQLSMGAPTEISIPESNATYLDPLNIAKEELNKGKIPMIIRRHLPNGTYEDWPLSELLN